MTATPARQSALRGILLYCVALVLFVAMGGLVKFLGREYPVPQLIAARYFFHFALMLAVFPRRIPTFLVSRRKGLQVLRAALILAGTLCSFVALRYLPMADITAITFTAPLIATALSVFLLHEHVGPRRWAAVAVGFAGVLVIVRPGAGIFQWPVLLPLLFACLSALYQIITRLVRDAADPLNALFYTALLGAALTLPLLTLGWRTPDGITDWLLLAAVGLLGGSGHFLVIEACRRAPVSVITPFSYTELFWASLVGFALFGDVPDLWTWVGAAIITASGLYVLHRERVRRTRG